MSGEACLDATGSAPTEKEVRDELAVVLAAPTFRGTRQQRNFLTYVVEKTLEGQGSSIKAYSLAIDVFGRHVNFDPVNDPIVRMEATRLRAALNSHYTVARDPGGIRIDLPQGGYEPRFTKNVDAPAVQADAVDARVEISTRKSSGRRILWLGAAGLASTIAVILVWLVLAQTNREPAALSAKPIVTLEFPPEQVVTPELGEFRANLLLALARFPALQPATGRPEPDAAGDQGVSNRYRIILTFPPPPGPPAAQWQIFSEDSDELLLAGELNDVQQGTPLNMLVGRLSARLAGYRGAIPAIETQWQLNHPSLGAGCVQRALFAVVERQDSAEIAVGQACLEATIKLQPGNSDARAVLAYLLVSKAPFEMPRDDAMRALDLARTAVSLAPQSNRAANALMVALYHNGQVQAAITEGRRGVLLNPNESATQAYLGWLLFALGQWEEGVRLANQAVDTEPLAYYDSGATIIMDAYRRGAYEETLSRAAERPYGQPYMVALTQLASLAETGRLAEAEVIIEAIRHTRPAFERSFLADMTARGLTEELVRRLAESLGKAGVELPPLQ